MHKFIKRGKPTNKSRFFNEGFYKKNNNRFFSRIYKWIIFNRWWTNTSTSIYISSKMVITSSFFYYKGNYIEWKTAALCAIGGTIGGYIGAKILRKIPEEKMKIVFTIFLIYAAYNMIFK